MFHTTRLIAITGGIFVMFYSAAIAIERDTTMTPPIKINKAPTDPNWNSCLNQVHGTVTNVSEKSITLLQTAPCSIRLENPLRLVASKELGDGLSGSDPILPDVAPFLYRMRDIQVGDTVTINFRRRNGVCIAVQLAIRQRPGGTVPPCPRSALIDMPDIPGLHINQQRDIPAELLLSPSDRIYNRN